MLYVWSSELSAERHRIAARYPCVGMTTFFLQNSTKTKAADWGSLSTRYLKEGSYDARHRKVV
jgi:hypothetical protein